MHMLRKGTRHLGDWTKGCFMMQVGPMWQANSEYATKWQVGCRSINCHGVAVVQLEHTRYPHKLPLLFHICNVCTMSYSPNLDHMRNTLCVTLSQELVDVESS